MKLKQNFKISLLPFLFIGLFACEKKEIKAQKIENGSNSIQIEIADKNATVETKNLLQNLRNLDKNQFLFGHQDDLAYGVNWRYEAGRSDVKDITGDYPAMYGWDLGDLEHDSLQNLDGVPFDKMKEFMQQVYERGGVNTVSWHIDNPLTGGDSWDVKENSFASILPNGEKHDLYKNWLDKAAIFFNSLKGSDGKAIPILFRPFHELTGDWFWWCQNVTSPEDYKVVWKFTKNYLESKGVHNLIWVYNTADFNTKEEFLKYYPGDDVVDILSFDKYQYDESDAFLNQIKKQMQIMTEIGQKRNKPIALAESGYEAIPDPNWWTGTVMPAVQDYPITFALFWRNHGLTSWDNPPKMHYYVSVQGDVSAQDFVKFYELPQTVFQKEATDLNLYQNPNGKN